MTKLLCALPMQVTIEILVDTEGNKLVDWGVYDVSIEEINGFLDSIADALLKAAVLPIDEKTGSSDIYTLDAEGQPIKIEDSDKAEEYEALLAAQEAKGSTHH